MNYKNSIWTQLCEQLIVIIAAILLFCLLPDFSDGNNFNSQTNISKDSSKIQSENFDGRKATNKHKKKKKQSSQISEKADYQIDSNELLHTSDENADEEEVDEFESVNSSEQKYTILEEPVVLAAEKLNRVEKINAEIEEQAFVLTVQQEQNKLTDDVLNKIESNLLSIKKMAQREGIDALIDNPSIEEIDKKIALYRKNS